jgi:hypothetical protein
MYGAGWLAFIVALTMFFPCILLFELGLLGWEGPLEGPLEVMIPLNSFVWPLVVIPLASGTRRLAVWFLKWPRPPESGIPRTGRTSPGK